MRSFNTRWEYTMEGPWWWWWWWWWELSSVSINGVVARVDDGEKCRVHYALSLPCHIPAQSFSQTGREPDFRSKWWSRSLDRVNGPNLNKNPWAMYNPLTSWLLPNNNTIEGFIDACTGRNYSVKMMRVSIPYSFLLPSIGPVDCDAKGCSIHRGNATYIASGYT